MALDLERAAMKGQLAEEKEKAARLKLRIEGNCAALRSGLNTALHEPQDIEVPQLAEQFAELQTAWAELQAALSKIARLERTLNG